ncbi:MAG: hypothetical protein ACR2MO_00970 [Acidimicrobiales bacterium]
MRRHNAFPRPGDRIRLAIPLPTDTAEPHARYGTVLERSCGQSNALRVRWDREEGPAVLAVDAGAESWLADAGWYWDKAHLEVVDAHDEAAHAARTPVQRRAPASEEERWLSVTPASAPSGGMDGSLDAVAEWEAALASEIDSGADTSWEDLLATALGHGDPVAPAQTPAAAPAQPSTRASAAPPAPPAEPQAPQAGHQAPQQAMAHKDIRKRTLSPATDVDAEPEEEPAPVAAPVQGWKGDDILPTPRSSGKRWGRR